MKNNEIKRNRHSQVELAKLVNTLKTFSSRLIRKNIIKKRAKPFSIEI